jgi:ubiquinone/menaquinone biosynthesis C-methylase UbiE
MPEMVDCPAVERVAKLYDSLDREVLHFGYWDDADDGSSFEEASTHLTTLALDHLEPRERDRLLDVGCGIGVPAVHIANATNTSIVGVTISGAQVTQARTRVAGLKDLQHRITFTQADAMRLAFLDDSFDGAYALESIQHMDRLVALRELARVVRPGGRIVLTDLFRRAPPPSDGTSVLDWMVQMWLMSTPITLSEYPDLLRAAGLRLVDLTDISDNVFSRSMTDLVIRMNSAIASGDIDAVFPKKKDVDFRETRTQQAVIQFIEEMARSEEVGYLILTAAVDCV